jgi:preprotein translocase subunit SecD
MIRENWRILLLVVVVVASGVALFAPVGGAGGAAGPTNLQFGLELSGGTQIRAPLVGLTAGNVNITPQETGNLSEQVAAKLGISPADIEVRTGRGADTVEVFVRNVSQAEFASALQSAGLNVTTDDIREGVTETTYQTAVDVLSSKISEAGLTGGTVQTVSTGGERYIQIEVPNQNRSTVRNLVSGQGRVKTVAYFPVPENASPAYCDGPIGGGTEVNGSVGGTCNVTVLQSQDAFQSIGTVEQGQRGQPVVPVTLTDQAAEPFTQAMQRFGFADPSNAGTCQFGRGGGGYCLLTVRDGEVVYAASVTQGLARDFATGAFVNDPSYVTSAPNASEAQELRIDLQAGALPAPLALQEGTTQYILPSLAEKFKTYSLITGIIAVLAVSVVVFVRYREPKIAIPMLLTALSEVFILLGFAAAVGLALDLSYIAGFIAVIGTGVDDLVIIADEILQSDVNTGRVFQSRFRRAFWIIGAAAATTIIALSPLAILSLGDLRGFAIVTIVGVLIGVLITRPAYGNILRRLLTDT